MSSATALTGNCSAYVFSPPPPCSTLPRDLLRNRKEGRSGPDLQHGSALRRTCMARDLGGAAGAHLYITTCTLSSGLHPGRS
nr:hypothetical protein CFP56_13249 [Quercus suber]